LLQIAKKCEIQIHLEEFRVRDEDKMMSNILGLWFQFNYTRNSKGRMFAHTRMPCLCDSMKM